MQKTQYIAIGLAVLFFGALYWGFDTKPAKQQVIDQARSMSAVATDATVLLTDARKKLTIEQSVELAALEATLENASPEEHLAQEKTIAGWWVRAGFPEASAFLAEKIAETEGTADAWTIAGATFQMALTSLTDEAKRSISAEKAVSAFEKAISLEPNVVEHRVNLALIYADAPPKDNPMQAVLMLRDLEKEHPEEVSVFNALGRLAIKTNQWEKAIQRLEKALSLDPNSRNTICLLAKAYNGIQNAAKAAEFDIKCAKAAQ